jgi:hypothetical protein
MCRKLLSNPYFVKTRSVSLDFVAMLNVTRQRSFHILSPSPPPNTPESELGRSMNKLGRDRFAGSPAAIALDSPAVFGEVRGY